MESWGDVDFNSHMKNTAFLDKSGDVGMMVIAEHRSPLREFARLKVGPVIQKDVGDRSPHVTNRIARAIAAHAPRASVTTLAKANRALTRTHVEAVAQAIAGISAGR